MVATHFVELNAFFASIWSVNVSYARLLDLLEY